MRILSASAFALASVLCGVTASQSLLRRERLLYEIAEFFIRLGNGFRCSNAPVTDLLYDAVGGGLNTLLFIKDVARGVESGGDLSALWREGVNTLKLYADEKDMLVRFGLLLGTTDSEGQNEICERYAERFTSLYTEALEKKKRLSGVYMSLGAAGGVCVMLMLV